MLSCPFHDALMLPHAFVGENLPEETLRCPNLSCSIVYIEGASEGFHTSGQRRLDPVFRPLCLAHPRLARDSAARNRASFLSQSGLGGPCRLATLSISEPSAYTDFCIVPDASIIERYPSRAFYRLAGRPGVPCRLWIQPLQRTLSL